MAKTNTKKMQSQMKINSKISAQDAIELGVQAVEKGNRNEAYNIFEQTSKLHPDTSEVWVWLGGTSPDLETAESAFEKAYALDPNNEQASLGLRWVRLKSKVSLADIVGATVPVPIAPMDANQSEQTTQAAQPHEPQAIQAPANIDEQQSTQQHEQDTAAEANATQSSGGMNVRMIIIAVVIVVLLLAALGAFWYLRMQ